MADLKGLKLQGGTYYAYVVVPRDVRHAFPTKSIWRTTETGDPRQAAKIGSRIRDGIKREIAQARMRSRHSDAIADRTMEARIALAAWATHEATRPSGPLVEENISPDWLTITRAETLRRAADDPRGYEDIKGFDQFLAGLLTAFGCPATTDDPVVAMMRQEAALTFLYAVKFLERGRQADAFIARARAAAEEDLESFDVVPPKTDPPLTAPSISISRLSEAWLAKIKPTAKQRQRFEHQFRRLIEYAGDRPANHLRRKDVTSFIGLVSRFPGRKRSAELAALPMVQLVEKFEAINASRMSQGLAPLPNLSETTVGDWFDAFRRCWAFGVVMEHVENNPWEGLREYVVAGGASIERRAFTDDEIQLMFSRPLFLGHAPDCDSYRNKPGNVVTKDARYWLPLLSLFHGQRLTEFAAMPLRDVRQTDEGTWYFDLTKRQVGAADDRTFPGVKSESSKRYIPLHPEIIRLGFPEFVDARRDAGEEWLFSDLDHESRFGPGHEISKWFGRWMDKIGLSDPTITHHSFRHTWKRHARATADVKEEMHDILSGHKGLNTVSRRYGEGAPLEALARDMAKIKFTALPT